MMTTRTETAEPRGFAVREKPKTRGKRRALRRDEKLSLALMFAIAVCVIVGLYLQANKLSRLASANRQIRSIMADNQLLEAKADNLYMELQMETRPDIISARAQSRLGMRMPTEAVTLAVGFTPEDSKSMSANAK